MLLTKMPKYEFPLYLHIDIDQYDLMKPMCDPQDFILIGQVEATSMDHADYTVTEFFKENDAEEIRRLYYQQKTDTTLEAVRKIRSEKWEIGSRGQRILKREP